MLINSNNSLPVVSGLRPEPALRQTRTPPQATSEYQANQISNVESEQGSRRPPLFIQPMANGKLSRTGEEAMRAYRDAAMAGEPAELVNRVNVTA
jgi:hypothetical protein